MHLKVADIKSARANKLKAVNQGPTVVVTNVQGSLVSGQSSTTTVPIVIPKPPKAIFSIVSWNVQDYKGSKITEGKRWVHDFIKRLVEALAVDLLILIETDVDLSEAAARIALSDHNTFGVDLPKEPCTFHLVGSGRTHKKVELPPSFTLGDLQNDKLKVTEDLDWRLEIEGFFYTYEVSYKGSRVDYPTLAQHIALPGFDHAQAVFTRNGDCPWCAGAGCSCRGQNTCLWCTCTSCKQQHEVTVVCRRCKCATCQERGLVSRPCTSCSSTNPLCTMCGGQQVDVWCPDCHCRPCGGEGEVSSSQLQPCTTCNGAKIQLVACPKCQGAGGSFQPCPGCHGGTSPFASSCHACGAKGTVPVPCDGCGGQTHVQQTCDTCKGAGALQVTVTTPCTHCGASGRTAKLASGVTCDACGGKATETIRCQDCLGARCRACEGKGEPSQDAWTFAVETASLLLKKEKFPGYDVETYAALWRTPKHRIPSKFGYGHEACDRKLAWLCHGSTLRSTDVNGGEIGYHDLNGDLNCRSPFTMPLWLSLDGKHVQVPLAALHALWGSGNKVVQSRSVSVEKMLDLAIAYPGADLAAMSSFPDALLLGDFNLHYEPTKSNAHGQAFRTLATKGYRNTTLGTMTSLATLDGGLKKMQTSSDPNQLYSKSYDHFLLKTGSDLDTHVVQAGVIDIIDMVKQMIAGNPTLAGEIDNDALIPRYSSKDTAKKNPKTFALANCKDPDLARAFYFYRDYVSDHIPILIDILVDTQDAKQAEMRDRMWEHGRVLGEIDDKARTEEPRVPRYRGVWTQGKYDFTGTPSFKVHDGGAIVEVSGKIIRWRLDNLVVRVRGFDTAGQDTGVDIDFEGGHTEPSEVLYGFRAAGITWFTGLFRVAQQPQITPQSPTPGQKAEPPAFWRPK